MPDLVLLAFDFGLKHIGVAVGQTITRTAQALTSIKAINGEPQWLEIEALIKTWKPQALIVGLPLNMDGTEQPLTHAAKKFAEKLTQKFNLPIHFVDERLTSVEARSQLFEKGGYRALKKSAVDCLAAKLILEGWLNK